MESSIMRYTNLFVLLLTALCFVGCGNASKNPTEEFDNDMPVDISEVIQEYELYQRSNADEQDSILFSFVDEEMCEGEVSLFEDTSFVIRLPEYKHSNNSYLAFAEEFYNNCSFAWNIWSNFEVWYRGETSGELRSANEIIKSIKDIDVNIINDPDLNIAAQIYKDSILILMSIGIDKWDDAHNPWNVRYSYSDAIAEKACHYYDDRDEFLNKYNIIVETAEGMGKARFQHYLNANEAKQLSVILTELNICKNFDEQCSLWKLWANTKKSQSEDGWLVAVGKLLMESGKYNPNLNRI